MDVNEEELPAVLDAPNVVISTPAVCRVCHCGSNADSGPLFSPCACKGTVGLIHKGCLEQWLLEQDTDQCNVCLYRYTIHRNSPPPYGFFIDRGNRKDVLRMMLDVMTCSGDVMMLVFGWTYASGFLGLSSWLSYLLVLGVLLFQTVFWSTVEVVRVTTWLQTVRQWRNKMATLEVLMNGDEVGGPGNVQDGPVVAEGKISALSSNTAPIESPLTLTPRPDATSPSSGILRSVKQGGASQGKRSKSADALTKQTRSTAHSDPPHYTL